MRDKENLHLKMQELCNCYATTDPLSEMAKNTETGLDGALKWLALAALHGVNSNAEKISVKQKDDGTVSVTAEYRETDLPSLDAEMAGHIFEAVRHITHIEDKKGKTTLALGIRDSSMDLKISVKDKDAYQKISIKFP